MTIPREALDLIVSFEGYLRRISGDRAAPYLCPARVPTIGYGTTFYEEHVPVTLDDPPITRERARDLLGYELRECELAVDRLTTVRLPDLSRGALVSFAYNAGSGAYRASGLRRAVNARRWNDVPAEFAKWRMGGGVILRGLERRRAAEAAMFMASIRTAEAALFAAGITQEGWNATVTGYGSGAGVDCEHRRV